MKVIINKTTTLDAIGCARLSNGRTTIMMHNDSSFIELARLFDGIESLSAEQIRGTAYYVGRASLVNIFRNEGSDVVSVTLSGLAELAAVKE